MEGIVSAAKEKDNIQMHKITEKYNKYGQYFLIDLTSAYQTPKEVKRQPEKDNEPEGQMSADDYEEPHEGVVYTIDKEGTASVAAGHQDDVAF